MNYEDLINRIKQKDNSAVMEFYNRFYKEVYYICYKITENEKDAEDVAQETLIKAIEKIDTLKNPDGMSAWLKTIANNLSLNYIKKNRKFDIVDNSEDMGEEIFEENGVVNKTPEDIVADKEVADILTNMIYRLPREQRITIFMFYYEELSVKEIAEIMECTEATVRSRINYARKGLRKQVDELENKGIKLRCIAILPFLFTIYSFEKAGIFARMSMTGAGIVSNGVQSEVASLIGNNGDDNNNVTDSTNKIVTEDIDEIGAPYDYFVDGFGKKEAQTMQEILSDTEVCDDVIEVWATDEIDNNMSKISFFNYREEYHEQLTVKQCYDENWWCIYGFMNALLINADCR